MRARRPLLAYCEVYLMTAQIAFRVIPRARLHETTVEDVTYDHDLVGDPKVFEEESIPMFVLLGFTRRYLYLYASGVSEGLLYQVLFR